MAKPHVYINVSQTAAVAGVIILGVHYMNIQRDAVGIQKTKFKDRIKQDAGKVVNVIATPFRHYF